MQNLPEDHVYHKISLFIYGGVLLAILIFVVPFTINRLRIEAANSDAATSTDRLNLDFKSGVLSRSKGGPSTINGFDIWSGVQRKAADRATIVADPAGSSRKVAKFVVKDGDILYGNERTEVIHTETEYNKTAHYYALSAYFPTDKPIGNNWGLFFQLHARDKAKGGPGGSPTIALENKPNSSQMQLVVRGGTVNTTQARKSPAGMTVTGGQWHDFIVYMKKSDSSDGQIKLWFKKGNQTEFKLMETVDKPNMYRHNGSVPPAYFKMGYYRSSNNSTATTVYHKGLLKTNSFEAAKQFFVK